MSKGDILFYMTSLPIEMELSVLNDPDGVIFILLN